MKKHEERRIHYIDSFKFSFITPLYHEYRYEISIRTNGLNVYKAGIEYRYHDFYCNNCEINNNEVTVFVRNHKLAPGKLYCQVVLYDKDGREVESIGIDPHITLTYDHVKHDCAPNDVDTQQAIDIVRLYDQYYKLKDRVATVETDTERKTSVRDTNDEVIEKMWITFDDELNPPIYTKDQIHERFVDKCEIKKYVKEKELNHILKEKVDNDYLNENYYTKSESYNLFLKDGEYYTKEEVDGFINMLKEQIESLKH